MYYYYGFPQISYQPSRVVHIKRSKVLMHFLHQRIERLKKVQCKSVAVPISVVRPPKFRSSYVTCKAHTCAYLTITSICLTRTGQSVNCVYVAALQVCAMHQMRISALISQLLCFEIVQRKKWSSYRVVQLSPNL